MSKISSYIGDVGFNSLGSPLQQSFGQVICLFIQILDNNNKNKLVNKTANHSNVQRCGCERRGCSPSSLVWMPFGWFGSRCPHILVDQCLSCFTSSHLQGSHWIREDGKSYWPLSSEHFNLFFKVFLYWAGSTWIIFCGGTMSALLRQLNRCASALHPTYLVRWH